MRCRLSGSGLDPNRLAHPAPYNHGGKHGCRRCALLAVVCEAVAGAGPGGYRVVFPSGIFGQLDEP